MATATADGRMRDSVADENPDLTRKRQKLSEELESSSSSPLSLNGSAIVEALPPDGRGTSAQNAIEVHDDHSMASPATPFLHGLHLDPTTRPPPTAQLQRFLDQLLSDRHVHPDAFVRLSAWLRVHLDNTKDESLAFWQDGYTREIQFFTKLAEVSVNIFRNGGDIFPRFPDAMRDELETSVASFFNDLATLSTRMVIILPRMFDRAPGRRDSAQGNSQQTIPFLWYTQTLAQILVLYDTWLTSPQDKFDFNPQEIARRQQRRFSRNSAAVLALTNLLQRLAESPNKIENAWGGIHAILLVLKALWSIDGTNAIAATDQAMATMHRLLLPAICVMGPRAVPADCHELLIKTACKSLTLLARHADIDQSAALYKEYIESDGDALLVHSAETSLETALQALGKDNPDTLIGLLRTAWTLQALRTYIFSSIMDVRSSGILQLSKLLLQLYNGLKNSPEGFDHPILQYVGRFMRTNELTKYIFGPESHASLISHSQNIIGFLAATFLYTDNETDLIWAACTMSVEAEFVKASFGVLAELCRYLDLDHLLYLAKKYAITSPDKLGKDAVDTLTDLFQKVQLKNEGTQDQDRRLSTAFISIDILYKTQSSEDNSSVVQLRETARTELLRFTTTEYSPDDRAQIYKHCLPSLLKPDDRTTTSIEIMLLFLNSPIVCVYEPQHLLSVVSVGALVDELGHFVQTRRNSALQADNATIPAIQSRINAIVRLQALPEVSRSESTWTTFSDYTIGKLAVNNVTRDCAWRTLSNMESPQNAVGDTASAMLRHCREAAIGLPLEFLTPTLLGVYGGALRQASMSSDFKDDYCIVLQDPIWRKLVRTAESTAYPEVSGLARSIVCDVLFEYPYMYSDKSRVAKCHAEFANVQMGRIQKSFLALAGSTDESKAQDVIQKVDLLADVFRRSRKAGAAYAASPVLDISLATEPVDELFHCRLHIYGAGQVQPKLCRLHVKASTKLSELSSKLPDITGAGVNRIIISGQALDVEAHGNWQMSQLGIGTEGNASDVISVCPKHTFQSDVGKLLAPTGEVETELLAQFDELEKLLEAPEEIAKKVFMLITEIQPPARPRQRVSAAGMSVQDLFPPDRIWKSAFTIHILKTQLNDYARIGVVDEAFRLHGIGLLIDMIMDDTRQFDHVILGRAMDCLVWFLRGLTTDLPMSDATDCLIEQPPALTTATLIKFPSEFVSRMIDICEISLSQPPELSAIRYSMTELVFKALMEAFRHQASVWKAFTEHARVVEMHLRLLLHRDTSLVVKITGMIHSFCADTTTANDATNFYMSMALAILPHVLEQQAPATQFFALATNALLRNKLLQTDEAKAREVCQLLIMSLQSYEHSESVERPIIDLKMVGLLRLLHSAIGVLQSFKKPLNMDDLAVKVFATLLFPPLTDHSSRPLVDQGTRALAYAVVWSTCESQADFAGLLAATLLPMQDATNEATAMFPGLSEWVRPAWQCSGLTNLGMTCYMNSLLQQLFANVHFRKFIFDTPVKDQKKQELLYHVKHLFARMQSDYRSVSDTSDLARVLGTQTDSQEDVHGFYEDFLSRLEANMPDEVSRLALSRFFSGSLISQIKGECGHVSPRTEPFVDLQMIVKNKVTLLDSLQEFVQGEPMEGANKYKCLSCESSTGDGRLVNAMRRSCPEKVPDNLTFCLKRFSFESMYGSESKVNDRFEFPQGIDMSRWHRAHLDDPEASIDEDLFELVGVIVHQGTLQLGHYWSYTLLRNTNLPGSRKWVKLEDRVASHCLGGIEEVQQECFGGRRHNGDERSDNAYVLFYQRKACLEEQIALPGPVQDPVTQWLLPPKVAIPPELQGSINSSNRWRNRITDLFADGFHQHILWLLSKYDRLTLESPSQPRWDSPNSDRAHPLEERASSQFAKQLSAVVATYFKRVVTCDSAAISHLDLFIANVKPLLIDEPRFAFGVLDELAQDDDWLRELVSQKLLKIRQRVLDFVLFCLANAREKDYMLYRDAFNRVRAAHAVVKDIVDPLNLNWRLYLTFAVELSQLGSWEMASVLDGGYLTWAFNTLYTPFMPDQQQKFPELLEHLQKHPSKVTALYDFLHVMLSPKLVFHEPDDQPPHHQITDDGLVLKPAEIQLLSYCRSQREATWMSCARFADWSCDWKDFGPGKLLASLMSPQNPLELRDFVTVSLKRYISCEENVLDSVLHLVLHFCTVSSDANATGVFHVLGETIHLWGRSELRFLRVAREAHNFTPCAVVSSIEHWFQFLSSKRADVREATEIWLREVVFEPGGIPDLSPLDTMRVRQTRKIVQYYIPLLMEACEGEHSRTRYESTIETLLCAEQYLKKVHMAGKARSQSSDENVRASITGPLQVELAELPLQLAELKAFRDFEKHWETDEPLPASRRSVELDSDEETTESEACEEAEDVTTSAR